MVAAMDPMFASINDFLYGSLVCPIPSTAALWRQMLLCGIPMLLRIARAISRDVYVFARGRQTNVLQVLYMFLSINEPYMRQAMSVQVPFRVYLFMLRQAAVRFFRYAVDLMRIGAISNLVSR